MNTSTNRTRLTALLLAISLVSLQTYADSRRTGVDSMTSAVAGGLLFSGSAQASSYQDLGYAVRKLENRSSDFIEQFDQQSEYLNYEELDGNRIFRQGLQHFDWLVQKLKRKVASGQQAYLLQDLFERIMVQADDIELDLPGLEGIRQLRRPWRRVKLSLRQVDNLLSKLINRNGNIRQIPRSIPDSTQLPWQQPRKKSTPKPRPQARQYPSWQEIRADNDIIEDYSERAKNAFMAQLNTNPILQRQPWARQTRDQLSGFDQSANRLRKIVYTRPQNPGAAVTPTVRQMQAQRQSLDRLMQGRKVNRETRNYWSVIGKKLDHLSCLLQRDGCLL